MADRYWVGGTGTWNTTSTTNWSATSGGAGGASVPTVADSVFFDQAGTYTVTMTGALACLDFNVTGGTVTFQNGTSPTLDVRGSWSTVAATVWNTTGTITFSATTSRTINTNAITIRSPITFNGVGGTWTLQNNVTLLSTLTTTLSAGTLALSTFTLTTGLFNSSGSTARIINFGTGKIVLNSATTSTIWNTGTTTNLTISGTPLVECIGGGTAVTKTINTGAPSEANSISFSLLDTGGTPTYAFSASNVVRNLIVNGAQTVSNIAITIRGSFTHLTTNGTTTFTAGANAWTFAATSGSYTITNIAGFTYDFPWTFGSAASTATWTIAANLTLGATRQLSLANGTFDFNNKTFSGAGVTIVTGTPTIANTGGPGSLSLTVPITHTSGSLTLPFNLTTTSASGYTLTAGTLTLNNFILTAPVFSSSGTTARTIAFGTTGQLALTGNGVTIFGAADCRNLTFTGTIYFNCTYTGSVGTRTILWGSSQGQTEVNALNVSFSGTTGIVLSPSATDTIELLGGFNNIDFTGFTGTLSNTARFIYGNFTVPASGGTFTAGTSQTSFSAIGTVTITTNGRTLDFPIRFTNGGTFRLLDNLTVGSTRLVTLGGATLDLNNFTLSTGQFTASGATPRTLAFGTGQLALTGNNLTLFDITLATDFTTTGTVYINSTYTGSTGTRTFVTGFTEAQASAGYNVSTSGTSGIVINPSADTVALTGNYNNIDFTGFTGTLSNTTRTIYGNLTVPASGGTFTAGTNVTTFGGTGTETITTNGRTLDFPITFSGVGGTFRLLDNLTVGSNRLVTLSNGTLDLNNFTLSTGSFNSSGSAARTLAFGTGQLALTDFNRGIFDITTATNFTTTGTVYINSTYTGSVGGRIFVTGFTEAQAAGYSVATSGTTGIVISPSATDSVTLTGSFNTVDLTGFTGTLTNTARTIFGDLVIPSSSGTFTAGSLVTTFAATSGTKTIRTNGRTIDFPVTIGGTGGTFQLQDALTLGSTRAFTLTAGALDLNNLTLSAATFSSSGSTARSVAFGTTGQISLAGNNATIVDLATATNFSYTGTPKIVSTYTGATGTRIFNIGGTTGANSNNIFSVTIIENPITTGGDGNASSGDDGGGGGGGIGGGVGTTINVNGGYTGGNANIASGNSLFTAVTNAGYTIGSGAGTAGGTQNSPSNAINGGNATGFGAGGGGAGYFGGNGGNGFLGGGGGGAAGINGTARTGGNGGNGAIVLQMTVSGTPTYNVLTSGTSYSIPANTTFIKIWAIGAGGGGAGAAADSTAGGGGGAGGISIMSSANTGTITYSIGTGGAGGSGTNNGLAGGNTTVTFDGTTLTSTGGAGGGYNSTTVSGVGGTGTDAFTVIPTGIAISIATDAIALSGGFNNVDLTGFNGTLSSSNRSIYGNFTIPSTGGSLSASSGVTSFVGSGSKTLSTGGRTLDFPVTIDGAGGTFQLLSNFAIGSTRAFTLTAGALDLNNFILSAATFSSNNGNIRSVAFGSTGRITLGGNGATIVDFTNMTNFTYTGTPKIYSTYTGATGTRTFNFGNAPATGATSTNVFDLSIGTSGDGLVISTGTDILSLIGSFNNFNLTGLSQTINNNSRFIYGDFTVPASGGTLTAGTSVLSFVGVSGTENITTNGRTLDFPITFDGAATFRLQSALLLGSTRVLTHNNGTIDLNGYTLTVGTAYTTGTGTKNLTFNGGSLVCPANTATAFNNAVPGGFTTTAGTGTGTISLTAATAKTFVGNNAIYNCDIDQGGAGALTITGFNTFNRIKSSYANTTANASIILPTGNTTTLAGIVGGSASNKMLDLSPATATAAPFRANVIISNSSIQTASYVQANSIIFNASELQNPSSQTSVLFDGTGDYLTIPNNSAFNFGSGNFTIECWVYPTTVSPADQVLIALYGYSNDRRSWYLGLNNANLQLRWDANGLTPVDAIITSTSSPFVANQWHHVAFVRSGNTFSGYVNGVLVVSGTSAVTLYNNTVDPVSIGTVGPTYTDFLNGYISNVRIIKGTALYTTNFTPTTSPLTAIANTSLLTCQSATLVDNGPNNFTVTAVGNSTVSPFSPFGNFSDGTTPWRLYLANSINNGDTLGAVFQEYSNTAPIVYYITRGTSFTVPADWNNSNNAIHIYGAGGGSSGSYVPNASGNRLGSAGGGGGGYTQVLNFTATPGSSVSYSIGLGGAAGSANTLSSSGGAGGNTTFAGIYTANGGGGSSITSTTTTAGTGGTGATANGGVGGLGGGAASATNNSSGGGGGGSGGPNGVGANGGTGTIGGLPSICAGGGGGGSGGGTSGTNAATSTPGTGGNSFIGVRVGGIGGLGTTFGGISGGRERGRASYDILGSVGGAGGGGGGGANGPGVRDELNIGGGAGGSGATDSDFANPGTAGQSGGIIIVYYPTAVVSGNFSNMFLLF